MIENVDLHTFALKIARSENLPMLPQVVSTMLKHADDPTANPREIERLIERDVALTAKVLRVANVPNYGDGGISSIGRALSTLGMSSVRQLVVGAAFQQIASSREMSTQFDKLAFWRHSLAVAHASRMIAKARYLNKADELYAAGLLHDVGMLVLEKFAPEELSEVCGEAERRNQPRRRVEKDLLGFDHVDLGRLLAEKWNLGDVLTGGIAYHHEPEKDKHAYETTCIVALANCTAYACGFCNHDQSDMTPKVEWLEVAGVDEDDLAAIRANVASEIEQAIMTFQFR